MDGIFISKLENVILCFCISSIGITSSTPPKSVNLAVETSFLFEPQDVEQNRTLLNSVRQFLDKLENLLNSHKEPSFRAHNVTANVTNSNRNSKRLTNFLTEVGVIVINYDDDDVKKLAVALNDEVSEIYVLNPTFHEMFKDALIKSFIAKTAKGWATTDPLRLKVGIAKYVTGSERSAFVSFFRNLNPFFEFDEPQLIKLVKKFAEAKETKNFAKTVQKTLQVMLKKYESFDNDSKNKFHEEIDKLSKYVVNYKNTLNRVNLRRRLNSDSTTGDLSEGVKEDFSSDNSIKNVKVVANEIRIDRDFQVNVGAYSKDIDSQKS